MARTYARIDVNRGADPDWRELSWAEQGVYDYLLSHPKLSLCGVLDVKLHVWRRGSRDEQVNDLLDALEEREYISWDRDTDELAIRTFVRHDGVLANRNLARGMWSAWRSIESRELRVWLVDNFPEPAFEERFLPPESALEIRCRNRGSEPGFVTVDGTSIPQPQPQLQPASAGDETGDVRQTPEERRAFLESMKGATSGAHLSTAGVVLAGTDHATGGTK